MHQKQITKDVNNTYVLQGKVHGEEGTYVAGYWVPYDQCEEHFNIRGGSNEKVIDICTYKRVYIHT